MPNPPAPSATARALSLSEGVERPFWLAVVAAALLLVLAALLGVQARQFTQLRVVPPSQGVAGGSAAAPALSAGGPGGDTASETEPLRRRLAQLEDRAQAVAAHNRQGLLLTGLLALLMLAAAALALRQVRLFRERRTELEEQMQGLRDEKLEAEAACQARSAFLASMGHEIRTPLHGLMGMLSLLRETGVTPRQIDHLRAATDSAEHLLSLLNDILDMAQLESGHLALSPTPVTLRALLRDVEALMRPVAAQKSIALHLDAEPAVPEAVLLDGPRVKQILSNLLSNAIKFSEHGAVVLDVRCTTAGTRGAPGGSAGSAGARLEFTVTDTGVGMDDATQARLFSRLMAGDSSRLRRPGGTGLGLEISRHLARLMGGDITVSSRLGTGSRFTFRMPLLALPDGAAPVTPVAPEGAGMPRTLHVLVAEDHPVNRHYMAALLEAMGHQAHFTADGEQALQAARRQRFDLVLMDLHMPVMDGLAATRAIRALSDPQQSTVPIVALTADAQPETKERCLVAGMNDFLTKPVGAPVLAACLRRLFGSGGNGPSGLPVLASAPGQAVQSADSLVDATAMAMTLQAISAPRLHTLITSFLDQGPDTVLRLRTAVRDAQLLDLRMHAHAAKGAALNLGLTGLALTAQALQDGAAHLPAHEIARLVQHFEAQLPATRLAVRAALDEAAVQAAQAARSAGATR